HAKASTKCSYLTLENPHHQRQACIKTCRSKMVWRIISARFTSVSAALPPLSTSALQLKPKIDRHAPRHRFKNPFTMSKTADNPPTRRSGISCFILENVLSTTSLTHLTASCVARGRAKQDGGAYRDRTDDLKLAKLAISQLS